SGNDLIYVPRNTSEMNFVSNKVKVGTDSVIYTPAQQAAAWDAFISQDAYLKERRGGYAQRNAVFLPMLYRADLSISQDFGRSIAGQPSRLQIRRDILKGNHLPHPHWGGGLGFVTN